MTNLFGEVTSREGVIRIIYKGNSFSGGQMQIKSLYTELESLERIIKKEITILIEGGKLDSQYKNVDIYIQISEGSVSQLVKIVFGTTLLSNIASNLVADLLTDSYKYFANLGTVHYVAQFPAEIEKIKNDTQLKTDLGNIISPINQEGDTFVIESNQGTINIFTVPEKEQILQNLEDSNNEDPLLKNGEFEENLTGVIRKLDLDASSGNYFGFTIDNGPSRVSSSLAGEFHLNDIKDIINEHLVIKAKVRYKNDEIKHIQIISYKLISSQKKLDFNDLEN